MYILLYIKLFKNLNITGSSTKKKKTDFQQSPWIAFHLRDFLPTRKTCSYDLKPEDLHPSSTLALLDPMLGHVEHS